MNESDVARVYVYVANSAEKNLETGIEQSVWGWKPNRRGVVRNHDLLASLKEGDYLYLGFGGSGHIKADVAQEKTISRIEVARLTGGLYEHSSPVWADDVYPYRVPLEFVETWEDVTRDDIGPEGIEALRRSACGEGGAFSPESRESVQEKLFQKVLEDYEDGLTDAEDPADSTNWDLPSDLDRRAYVLARAEQKKLRRKKLNGRSEVYCDLCQLLLPVRLVHTAHIRRRSQSPHEVRLDPHNLMFACVLGCDALFEHGYVYVDVDGCVQASEKAKDGAFVSAVERLGKSCSAFTKNNAEYFAWHRGNIANVNES